jgi:hypothetical protein
MLFWVQIKSAFSPGWIVRRGWICGGWGYCAPQVTEPSASVAFNHLVGASKPVPLDLATHQPLLAEVELLTYHM